MRELPKPSLVVKEVRDPFFVTEKEIDAWLDYQKAFDYVRETEPNEGPEVEIFQKWCYGKKGDSWCADFQCYTWDHVWPKLPLARSGSCQNLRQKAAKLGWLLKRGTAPRKGDVGFVIDVKKNHAHHIFSVTGDPRPDKTFDTVEGNTNPAGGSNGFGVFERATRRMGGTTTYEFMRFPRQKAAPQPATPPSPTPVTPKPAAPPAPAASSKPPAPPPGPIGPPPRPLDSEDTPRPPFWRFVLGKLNPFGQ